MKSSSRPKTLRGALYGFHAVKAAWLNTARQIEALYMTEAGRKSFADVLRDHPRQLQPQMLHKEALEKILPRGAVHQGLAVAAADLEEMFLQDLMIRASTKPGALILILDQVTDPHNVGAILRSACVFGAAGVILQRKHAPDLNGVLAKTACGAVEHIPVVFETNLSRALNTLKEDGFFAYGLDERGTQAIGEIKPGGRSVLVLGAEGRGLRRLVAENCDALVKLPTSGPIASLNVSNAAAVALYALKH